MSRPRLENLLDVLDKSGPEGVLRVARDRFAPSIVATSSFQPGSAVLLHILSEVCPEVPVLFADTGYHFRETLEYRDRLAELLDLNVRTVRADPEERRRLERRAATPCTELPDLCCEVLKVDPLRRELADYEVWVTGIRRSQTGGRNDAEVVMKSDYGPIRLHPLVRWSRSEIDTYIAEHGLPEHPLVEQGYRSIGCAPVTEPVEAGQHEREGRWPNVDKEECGLHQDL